MNVSFTHVENIFKTLPVGYYLGRRIEYLLKEDCDSSFFDPLKDKIIISYPMIARAVKTLKKDDELESIIRGLLYHEVAHVILTPPNLKSTISDRYATPINIVEDERIETICKNLFMSVDFKRNIVLINDYKGEEPKNAQQAFYHLVRFHKGNEYWIKRLTKILQDFGSVTPDSKECFINNYLYAIKRLYDDFTNDYKEEEKAKAKSEADKTKNEDKSKSSDSNGSKNEDDNTENDKMSSSENSSDSNESDDVDEGTGIMSTSSMNAHNDDADSNSSAADSEDDIEKNNSENEDFNSKDEFDDIVDKIADIDVNEIDREAFKKLSLNTLNIYYDQDLELRLRQIIEEKLKKQAVNGSAINSYSGRFNYRAVATRDDYKWWTQQNRAGHVKQYSKVHFNLFIDNSGSFGSNDEKMNIFIRTLDRINDPDFSFDIITINTKVVEWPNHEKRFSSFGGNCLKPNISEVIKRHQKRAANNYNIVLFDGDAHSDDGWFSTEPFTKFDNTNTFIISDDYNRRYMEPVMTKAKIKYVRNYCEVFINTICELLERAL